MSWQAYIDDHLIGTKQVTSAAILGLDGSTWATSPGFNISVTEGKFIAEAWKDPSKVQASGFRIKDEKYMFLSMTDNALYGKKGSTGICAQKTSKCIIIGYYDDKIVGGQCNAVVGKLADWFRENGY